jgi:DNA-binding CsgD family transcriptional regulator
MKNFDELAGAGWPVLTPREREVVYPVAEGKSNKLIAMELGISMRTVEAHRARIFYKMGVRNAVQLARTVYSQPETVPDLADLADVADVADVADATATHVSHDVPVVPDVPNAPYAPGVKESAHYACDLGDRSEDDLDETINQAHALVESHNWFTPQKKSLVEKEINPGSSPQPYVWSPR